MATGAFVAVTIDSAVSHAGPSALRTWTTTVTWTCYPRLVKAASPGTRIPTEGVNFGRQQMISQADDWAYALLATDVDADGDMDVVGAFGRPNSTTISVRGSWFGTKTKPLTWLREMPTRTFSSTS